MEFEAPHQCFCSHTGPGKINSPLLVPHFPVTVLYSIPVSDTLRPLETHFAP